MADIVGIRMQVIHVGHLFVGRATHHRGNERRHEFTLQRVDVFAGTA